MSGASAFIATNKRFRCKLDLPSWNLRDRARHIPSAGSFLFASVNEEVRVECFSRL
jgi:hypothetical protein